MFSSSKKNIFLLKTNNVFEFSSQKKWLLFAMFLCLMILDRVLTLFHFGFIYTDIDQMVMWNGAFDYSKAIFHEPFFYGQSFNYMLEGMVSVPFLWLHIPVYIALPITTSAISLLPFIILSIFFIKREHYFWAYLCLAFPLLLPLQYNFITTLSRGFVQAHLFVPLLFLPLFNPQSKTNVIILYLASALCFIANQSSLLIIVPIGLYVYTYHFKSVSFYYKSLLVIPFFIADYFAKHFYILHPEKVRHELIGLKPDAQTFITGLKNSTLFENLFPLFSGLGIVYPFLFILLGIISVKKSMMKEFLFIISIFILLLISLAIPKVQELIPNTGIFFTSSRLYLYLPILLIITLHFVFSRLSFNKIPIYFLLLVCLVTGILKNINIKKTVQNNISKTIFPVARNQDLITRAGELKQLTEKYNLDLIVHSNPSGWNYVFDSYAFNPLTQKSDFENEKTISVNLYNERRTWLYQNAEHCKQILLNGIKCDKSLLKEFDYEVINQNQIVIKNNKLNVSELFTKLNLHFGNTKL